MSEDLVPLIILFALNAAVGFGVYRKSWKQHREKLFKFTYGFLAVYSALISFLIYGTYELCIQREGPLPLIAIMALWILAGPFGRQMSNGKVLTAPDAVIGGVWGFAHFCMIQVSIGLIVLLFGLVFLWIALRFLIMKNEKHTAPRGRAYA